MKDEILLKIKCGASGCNRDDIGDLRAFGEIVWITGLDMWGTASDVRVDLTVLGDDRVVRPQASGVPSKSPVDREVAPAADPTTHLSESRRQARRRSAPPQPRIDALTIAGTPS